MFIRCYNLHRYLARAVLAPFAYKAPKITMGVLNDVRIKAPAAIPQILGIIDSLATVEMKGITDKIDDLLGLDTIDGRLSMQYALSIVYSLKVYRATGGTLALGYHVKMLYVIIPRFWMLQTWQGWMRKNYGRTFPWYLCQL